MVRPKRNIIICGMHWSGSSALVDLFKEYSNVYCIPNEFDELRRPLLLNDVYFSGRDIGYRKVIRYAAFTIFKRQLHALLVSKRRRFSLKDIRSDIIHSFQLLLMILKRHEPAELRDGINEISKYIKNLGFKLGGSADYIVFDQPILLGSYHEKWRAYFGDFELFIVIRDPKDQMNDLIENNHLFLDFDACVTGGLHEIYGQGHLSAIKYNVDVIKSRYRSIRTLTAQSNVHVIKFEDLVENYETSIAKFESITGLLPENHTDKRRFFNPYLSSQNIGRGINNLPVEYQYLINELYGDYNEF